MAAYVPPLSAPGPSAPPCAPSAHPARKGKPRLSRAVSAEYSACRRVEDRWMRRLGKNRTLRSLSGEEASGLVEKICRQLGIRPPKVITSCGGFPPLCTGRYWDGELQFPPGTVPLNHLLHELAHHVVHVEGMEGRHHRDYLWVLEMVFLLVSKEKEPISGKVPV